MVLSAARFLHTAVSTGTHTQPQARQTVHPDHHGDGWIMSACPPFQCAASPNSINGLLPPPWGDDLPPMGLTPQKFFFLAACAWEKETGLCRHVMKLCEHVSTYVHLRIT